MLKNTIIMKEKRKTRLDAFGERYILIEHDGGYCLYDKERPARRVNCQFLGKFYLASGRNGYSFNGDYFDSVEPLVAAMDRYNQTLPFAQENYDPTYRKNILIEYCIRDYLNGLGFKEIQSREGATFLFANAWGEVICRLFLSVKPDTTEGFVSRLISQDRWIAAEFNDLDSAIGACNSLISSHCSVMNAELIGLLTKLTGERASQLLDKTFDVKTLSTYTEDAKQKTIEFLKQELKRLEG